MELWIHIYLFSCCKCLAFTTYKVSCTSFLIKIFVYYFFVFLSSPYRNKILLFFHINLFLVTTHGVWIKFILLLSSNLSPNQVLKLQNIPLMTSLDSYFAFYTILWLFVGPSWWSLVFLGIVPMSPVLKKFKSLELKFFKINFKDPAI